ncbi:replication endonuclease [Achromobacter sp. F4_2707]|uniref:replication endonuclease n=1 Tax=Achromobacter sp. F4_2707 TaxID=3114286 RepID=UPI0039C700A9
MTQVYTPLSSEASVFRSLEEKLNDPRARPLAAQLRITREIGLHRFVRRLSNTDTGADYTEEEIESAKTVLVNEARPLFHNRANHLKANLPTRHGKALEHALKSIASNDIVDDIRNIDKTLGTIEDQTRLDLPAVDANFSDFQLRASQESDRYQKNYQQWMTIKDDGAANKLFQHDLERVQRVTGWTKPRDMDANSFYARASTEKFWLRHLQKQANKSSLQLARTLQILGRGKAPDGGPRAAYLPWDLANRKHAQIDLTQDWMKRTVMTSGSGEQHTLFDINEKAKQRQLAELDIRAIAMHEIHTEKGMLPFLVTLTCPSRFHSTITVGNKKKKRSIPNPRFDSTLTAQDGANHLQKNWTNFRALAQKIAGPGGWGHFGDMEGHTDATPHRHILIYCQQEHEELMHAAMLHAFLLSDSPNEPGARKHRVRWERVRSDGGAKKYITKILRYITKTFNGKLTSEALYASSIGRRAFTMMKDHVGIWRGLRAIQTPYKKKSFSFEADPIPTELLPAWAASRGLDQVPERYSDELRGSVTRPTHYKTFLQSIAVEYRAAWHESDFFNTELSVLNHSTGEVISITAHEEFDEMMYFSDDELELLERKTRKLNQFGEPLMPSGGAARSPLLIRIDDMTSEVHFVRRDIVKWSKETLSKEKTERKVEKFLKDMISSFRAGLQLSIQSQAAAGGAIASFDDNSLENSEQLNHPSTTKRQTKLIPLKLFENPV